MTLSKGAVGNLMNRYRAVLKKCHLMNMFGSLAVAGLLVAGSAVSATANENTATAIAGEGKPVVVDKGRCDKRRYITYVHRRDAERRNFWRWPRRRGWS